MKIIKNIKFKREVILLASLFLFLNGSFAQLYNFKKISVEQGLSAHGVYTVAEGPKGKLWIGLEGEGVNIFDGWEITRLSDARVGKNIRSIFKDAKNRMWLGSAYGGISVIDGQQTKRYSKENGLPVNHIRGFAEDANGGIWVATLGGGVVLIKNDNIVKNYGANDGLPSLRCKSIFYSKNNEVWVGTTNGVAIIKDGEVIKVISKSQGLPSNKILSIKEVEKGIVWVGTEKGLAFVKGDVIKVFSAKNGLVDDRIKDVLPVSFNEVWVASRSGLGKIKVIDYNTDSISIKWYNDQNGLSNNRIRCLYQDASKALWIGTYFGGLNRFFNASFSMYNKSSGLLDNVITAVDWNNSDSSLWMGSHENGVDILNENSLKSINKLVGLSENQVTSIAHFNASLSLIGTNEGLNLIKDHEVERVWDSYDGLFKGNYISTIATDDKHAIVLTNQDELFVVRADRAEAYLDSSNTAKLNRLVTSYVNSVSVVGNSFWIGTDSLFYEFKFEDEKVVQKSTMGINGVLKVVGRDSVLVGFTKDNKIFKISGQQLSWEKQLKKSEEIKFVIQSEVGSFWFGLKGRLLNLKFNKDQVFRKSYSLNEGFMGESALKSAVTQDVYQNIYVGTIKGMLKFEPTGYVGVKRDLEVHFENLLSNKTEYDWGEYADTVIGGIPVGLVIPHRMNHLTFAYKAYHLKSPKEVVYKIELDGEQSFSYETKSVAEEFHDLIPGEYELKIYAKTQWGEWSTKPLIFKFEITPPIWMTKFFQFSVALFLIASLFLIYKLRTRKLEREKRKLTLLVEERTKDLNEEKQKSEKLLLNILPVEVANELKVNGFAKTRKYKKASVLFTDFKGFTKMSSEISPEQLVEKLDEIFVAFDEVIERNNLEKIKTIGDAYMCASGIPDQNPNQVKNIVLAGLQLVEVMNEFNKRQRDNNDPEWQVRVGIHTGELIAGVVGKKKFAYDVWGDTVNIASRMESNSEPGRVNVSKATYDEIKSIFITEERGKINTKNRGDLDMYFINQLMPQFAKQNAILSPNQDFYLF